MYFVTIRESIMIAHSLTHPFFGPAQNLHGATFVVDVTFQTEQLDEHHVVIDIGVAHEIVKEVLQPLNYQNLDDLEVFKNQLTTTEFIAKHIHDEVIKKSQSIFSGKLKVNIQENPNAWAGYSN